MFALVIDVKLLFKLSAQNNTEKANFWGRIQFFHIPKNSMRIIYRGSETQLEVGLSKGIWSVRANGYLTEKLSIYQLGNELKIYIMW